MMPPLRNRLRTVVLMLAAPALLRAQALTSITSLYVSYNTRKVTLNPTGEVKARLDSLERDFFVANRAGRTGEVRRLLAKGMIILAGKPWTDVTDYNASLLLRTDRVVVDPATAYTIRVEQLYAPAIDLRRSLSAHATLVSRGTTPGAAPIVVKDLGTFNGVSRDLRESPYLLDVDLRDVPDGRYGIVVDVADSTRALGRAALGIAVHKGLDGMVARLETQGSRAPAAARAELLYPVDRMRNVNRGLLELRTLDVERDFAAAAAVASALDQGKSPFDGVTGDLKRHYLLEAAHEIMPYHMMVPSGYAASKAYPLIIALHGLGATEDSFFDAYGQKLPQLAASRGYLLAAPLGYRVDGGYGWGVGTPPTDPVARRASALSEEDVMEVLAQVRQSYNVDPSRIYLMGHSMGAIGTWKLAPKYASIWAAVAAFSGQGVPSTVEQMRKIPEFVVHGDADPTVNVAGSRAMVAVMKSLNMDVQYTEVPGGNHGNVAEPNFPAMFDFFDAHRRSVAP